MRNSRSRTTISVLKQLYRLNHPESTLLSIKRVLQEVRRLGLQEDLQELADELQVDPSRTLDDYIEAVRINPQLAYHIFFFFHATRMVLSAGKSVRGEFFIAVSFDIGLEKPVAPLIPALVPVENTEYRLIPVDRFGWQAQVPIERWPGAAKG